MAFLSVQTAFISSHLYMKDQALFSSKRQILFFVLSGFFICNALVAEIIGGKIFSVEAVLGMNPANIPTPWGDKWSFNQAAGALNWPIVFIIGDMINEYFGRKGVRWLSFLTAGLITYSFFIIYTATTLPPAQFWMDINKGDTNFNIDFAYKTIFRQGLGIIIGSITAFLLAQFLDVTVFQYLRKHTGHKHIWIRATGSTLVSQLIDSFVVVFVAFYIFSNWTAKQALSVALNNYLYKFIISILMIPVLYVVHYLIDRWLGEDNARKMADDAATEMPVSF